MSQSDTANEHAIEDVLAQFPDIAAEVLDIEETNLRLVERQQSLSTGRTDLVYLTGEGLVLVELKAVTAAEAHVEQLSGYIEAYEAGEVDIASGRDLIPVLLAPEIPDSVKQRCEDEGIQPQEFDPAYVFKQSQSKLLSQLPQFQVTGLVTSVARVGLINGYLRYLAASSNPVTDSVAGDAYDEIGKGTSTDPAGRVPNFRKVAKTLGLVTVTQGGAVLTDRGEAYVEAGDGKTRPFQVTNNQAQIIVDVLYDEPLQSDLTYSLIALLESVFELSRNQHPVPEIELTGWFAKKVGKQQNWGDRTRKDVVRWLGSYLDELGLLARIDNEYHLTPKGFDLLSYYAIEEGKALLRGTRRT